MVSWTFRCTMVLLYCFIKVQLQSYFNSSCKHVTSVVRLKSNRSPNNSKRRTDLILVPRWRRALRPIPVIIPQSVFRMDLIMRKYCIRYERRCRNALRLSVASILFCATPIWTRVRSQYWAHLTSPKLEFPNWLFAFSGLNLSWNVSNGLVSVLTNFRSQMLIVAKRKLWDDQGVRL